MTLKKGVLKIANVDLHNLLCVGFADSFFEISKTLSVNWEGSKEIIIDGSLLVQRDGT